MQCTLNTADIFGNVSDRVGLRSGYSQTYTVNHDFQLTVTLNWDTEMLLG